MKRFICRSQWAGENGLRALRTNKAAASSILPGLVRLSVHQYYALPARFFASAMMQHAAKKAAEVHCKVMAAFMATRIDTHAVSKRLTEFGFPTGEVKSDKEGVTVRLQSRFGATAGRASDTYAYLSFFKRGAVVLANAPQGSNVRNLKVGQGVTVAELLADKTVCPQPLALAQQTEEDLDVVLAPPEIGIPPSGGAVTPGPAGAALAAVVAGSGAAPAHAAGQGAPDITVWSRMDRRGDLVLSARALDWDSARILNGAMAQTVHLAYIEGRVDKMSAVISEIHSALEAGEEARLDAPRLYKHLSEASNITAAIMLSGLQGPIRPGTIAWSSEVFSSMHEQLAEAFEVEDRWDDLQSRLEYVTETIKYALELHKEKRSLRLEQLIVILIAAEIIISLASHLGGFDIINDALHSFTRAPKA